MVRGLVQRVLSAEVTVEGKSVAKIGKGLCVLVGINQKDDAAGMESLLVLLSSFTSLLTLLLANMMSTSPLVELTRSSTFACTRARMGRTGECGVWSVECGHMW